MYENPCHGYGGCYYETPWSFNWVLHPPNEEKLVFRKSIEERVKMRENLVKKISHLIYIINHAFPDMFHNRHTKLPDMRIPTMKDAVEQEKDIYLLLSHCITSSLPYAERYGGRYAWWVRAAPHREFSKTARDQLAGGGCRN